MVFPKSYNQPFQSGVGENYFLAYMTEYTAVLPLGYAVFLPSFFFAFLPPSHPPPFSLFLLFFLYVFLTFLTSFSKPSTIMLYYKWQPHRSQNNVNSQWELPATLSPQGHIFLLWVPKTKKKKNDNANRISCPEKGVLQSLTYKCWDSFCTHLQRITHAFKYPGTKNPTNGSCASSHFSALDSLARTGHLRVALSPSIFQTKRTYISFLHTMNLEKQKLLQRVSKLIQQAVNEPF